MKEKLATFKVEENKWNRFRDKAGNASRLLASFVDAYLAGLIDTSSWDLVRGTADESVVARLNSLDSSVDTRIVLAIEALRSDLSPSIEALSLDKKPPIEDLQKRVNNLEGEVKKLQAVVAVTSTPPSTVQKSLPIKGLGVT